MPVQAEWDVFIAHASPDKVIARELYRQLKDRCRVFYDEASIALGETWPSRIEEAQRSARYTVVLVSSATDKAYYEHEEIAAAIALAREDGEHHRVVPVYLDRAAADAAPYGLRVKHGITLDRSTSLSDVVSLLLADLEGVKRDAVGPGYSSPALRIVFADDSLIAREGVIRLLSTESSVEVVEQCDDLDGLLAAVDRLVPDVVLTDLRMPPTRTDEGVVAANKLRQSHPSVGVVVLSAVVDRACASALVADGSERRAYLLKDHVYDVDSLLAAIKAVAAGGSYIDSDIVSELLAARSQSSALAALTARELEVLAEVASGLSNRAIGRKLFISERAVEKHINAIFTKLDLFDGADANRRVRAALLFLTATTSREWST